MAIINKDFKLKNGLIVEGTNATVNGYDILTKNSADQAYIIGLIGGSATPDATPDTVVLRDENANFSANEITADIIGTVSDISNHSTSDLSEGTNLYYTADRVKSVLTNSTQTNIQITEIAGELHITAENGVADSTTDDLTEGTNHLYFTNQRALDATSTAYDAAGAATTAENNAKSYADGLAVNYDPAGSADTVQGNLEDHASDTITHGVTSDIVGTSDVQTLTNKTIGGSLGFNDTLDMPVGGINTNFGSLNISSTSDINVVAHDIVLSTTGNAYVGSTSTENEIATHGYVDNAISGLNWKQAVNLLSTTNVDISGVGPAFPIDGHSAPTSDYRILLTGQSTNSENGIWDYIAVSQSFVRASDADAFGELIGAAVYVMEGTQYGSTSWVQSNHYLTDFTGQSWTQFSGQGSVTAGTGITVNGLEVSVNRTTVDGWYDALGAADTAQANAESYTDSQIGTLDTGNTVAMQISQAQSAAKNYADGLASNYDAAGSADIAEFNAKAYADSLAPNYDPAGAANTAYNNAVSYADSLTTDDVAEGITNHYYTDNRAKTATRNVLVNATKNNIQITEDLFGNLTITAENGVADSTTDDLDEGSTNLYFNNSRAIDAINGNLIQPEKIDIAMYRREEATQQYVANASTVAVHNFNYPYESVKYLVRVVGWDGGVKHSQITEILVTVDGNNNIAITEYGNVHTSTNPLATFSAEQGATGFNLTATTAVSGCEIIAAATMLSWAD